MHLPNLGHRLGAPPGGRRASRWRARDVAIEWATWLLAAFNYWELSCPKTEAEYVVALGPWEVSAAQEDAFEQLVRELLPFGRLASATGEVGRGQNTLMEVLSQLKLGEFKVGKLFAGSAATASIEVLLPCHQRR